jgi:hypothetical protein
MIHFWLLNVHRQIFHAYPAEQKVQQYIKQMDRNKGGATTFDFYWKNCLES